jgi:hypothetical protein|tara:strand:- start:15 stop:461 length:447 start_codon:yes stop_codon:yes gene_type:complete
MTEYWVGQVGRALFVFDEEIQSSDSESVTLFSYSFDQPIKLTKAIVRRRIRRANAAGDTEDVIKRFENWKKFYSSSLKSVNESPWPDTEKLLRAVQSGVVKAYWGRKAHCHGCGKSLTGTRGNICHDCFWITCKCGACGCGWTRESED